MKGKRFARGAAQQNIAEANNMYNNRINSSAAFSRPQIGDSLDSPAFARRTPGVKYNRSQSEIAAGMNETDNILNPMNRKGSAVGRARAAGGTGEMGAYGRLNEPTAFGPGVINNPIKANRGSMRSPTTYRTPRGSVNETGYNMWAGTGGGVPNREEFLDYRRSRQSRSEMKNAIEDIDNSILSRASAPGRDMRGTRSRPGRYRG
jgi:hypothetical protein